VATGQRFTDSVPGTPLAKQASGKFGQTGSALKQRLGNKEQTQSSQADASDVPVLPPPAGMPTPAKLFHLENGKPVPVFSTLMQAAQQHSTGKQMTERLAAVSLLSPIKQTKALGVHLSSEPSKNATESARGSMSLLVPPQKKVHGKKSREEMLLTVAGKEIEQLSTSLDDAHRERDMQRKEIARLRSLLTQHVMGSSGSLAKPDSSATNFIGKLDQTPLPGVLYEAALDAADDHGDYEYLDGNDDDEDGDVRATRRIIEENDDESESNRSRSTSSSMQVKNAANIKEYQRERNLTTADITGRPSEEDLLDIALAPVSVGVTVPNSRNSNRSRN
jgi:hypothetical protein